MAFVCVDRDGTECIYKRKPCRNGVKSGVWSEYPYIELSKGSIRKLIGRDLTWSDEPQELT